METWRVVQRNKHYSVSNLGRIRNDRTGRILKQTYNRGGYLRLHLGANKTSVDVHILVAEAFLIEKPSPRHMVDHRNKNKADARATNLRWATPAENTPGHNPDATRCVVCGRACPNCSKRKVSDG